MLNASATDWALEWRSLAWIAGVFLVVYFLPVGSPRFDGAVTEALGLARWYAREHVLLCLVPAFFIAGAISVFVSQAAVLRYLGAEAPRILSYGVASVSGSILAVCSCTVLPLFGGIYLNGAGLGPATAFLYSGPAINVLAMILTARVLGLDIGIARAVGAVGFSLLVGLLMQAVFWREEKQRSGRTLAATHAPGRGRPLWQSAVFFAAMVGILVFANWARPEDGSGAWRVVYALKWRITAGFALVLAFALVRWIGLGLAQVGAVGAVTAALAFALPAQPSVAFGAATVGLSVIASRSDGEAGAWFHASWDFAKQIFPLLLLGILAAGVLLGRPGHEGMVPSAWIAGAVGGNSVGANLFASVAGALMYFATLTEVPIVQGLMGSGMGEGPSLALLLAGPALSLPSILVLRSIMGAKRTLVFVLLVVVMATVTGVLFGAFA